MLYQVSVYCISDTGYIRQNNEDSWKFLKNEQFFVLADGMGGHQAGEIASKEAVEELCNLFQKSYVSDQNLTETTQILYTLIQEVNSIIYQMSYENPILRGMGTTVCCIFLHPQGLIYGHVGDSRIYRFRANQLEQLTKDHSLLCELIDLGQLSEQQAEDFLYKNIITKAIGTEPSVEPSMGHSSLECGDILLLCSDGLSDLVSFKGIQEIIRQNSEEDLARLLVEKAKENGGCDNITVMTVKVQNVYQPDLS